MRKYTPTDTARADMRISGYHDYNVLRALANWKAWERLRGGKGKIEPCDVATALRELRSK